MKIQIDKNKTLATISDIKHLEGTIESNLPKDYIEFLQKFNGGHVESNTFQSAEFSESVAVRNFFGLNTKNSIDIYKILKTYENRIPKNVIPIGEDDCGNLFCLSLRNKDFNTVYFWDHELEADGETPTESNLFKIANSFSEFLNGDT